MAAVTADGGKKVVCISLELSEHIHSAQIFCFYSDP